MSNRFILYLLFLWTTTSLANNFPGEKRRSREEFRGIWVATINNIDWPSQPGLSVAEQKRELLALVLKAEKFELNTLIFQVRPTADAFYNSNSEPWSYYLTGEQGKAPSPFYDPVAYAIELCHERGIEFHAWFNPFRVRNDYLYKLGEKSIARKNRHWLVEYGEKTFLDPGIPEVCDYVTNIMLEVVNKYDIDAIHLDDYFYPYPVKGKKFPDDISFQLYGGDYPNHKRNEWRRKNIDDFIQKLHDSVKLAKPWVKIGISPFGIWRHQGQDAGGSPGNKGLSSYDDLNADVLKWMRNEWVDYVIPQLYWAHGSEAGDFKSLANWWNKHTYGRHVYFGLALYKQASTKPGSFAAGELQAQMKLTRKLENVKGFSFFSMSQLNRLSSSVKNNLMDDFLSLPAKMPPMQWVADRRIKPKQPLNVLHAQRSEKLPVPKSLKIIKTGNGWWLTWQCGIQKALHEISFEVYCNQLPQGEKTLKRDVICSTDKNHAFIPSRFIDGTRKRWLTVVSYDDAGKRSAASLPLWLHRVVDSQKTISSRN